MEVTRGWLIKSYDSDIVGLSPRFVILHWLNDWKIDWETDWLTDLGTDLVTMLEFSNFCLKYEVFNLKIIIDSFL